MAGATLPADHPSTRDGDRLTGFLREDDVVADEEIRVFGSTRESWQALAAPAYP